MELQLCSSAVSYSFRTDRSAQHTAGLVFNYASFEEILLFLQVHEFGPGGMG